MVSNLEDKTDVSNVATLVKLEQWLDTVLTKDMCLSLLNEVDASAHYSKADQTLAGVDMFVLEWGTDHRDQFVVCLEAKLWVLEDDLKPFLELEE